MDKKTSKFEPVAQVYECEKYQSNLSETFFLDPDGYKLFPEKNEKITLVSMENEEDCAYFKFEYMNGDALQTISIKADKFVELVKGGFFALQEVREVKVKEEQTPFENSENKQKQNAFRDNVDKQNSKTSTANSKYQKKEKVDKCCFIF